MFGPPFGGGSSSSHRKYDIHKHLFKNKRDGSDDDSDDDDQMREIDLDVRSSHASRLKRGNHLTYNNDDQSYENYTNSSGEEEFDDDSEDDYEPRGRGSFITLDGDDDDEYDIERGSSSFSYSSSTTNRVTKRFNSKPKNRRGRRGRQQSADETKLLKERPEKLECTLTVLMVVIVLIFLLVTGFLSIYRSGTAGNVISKDDDKGLTIHKDLDSASQQTENNDAIHHSHGHVLRGKHQHGKKSSHVKSRHHSIISNHVNSKNHTSYFEQMDSIWPVLPFDGEFLFENTPISAHRLYSKDHINIHKFNSNHLGKDTPLVSVISTLTANSNEDIFKNTRDSILRQTFRFFEWIIIVNNQGATTTPHNDKIFTWLSINPSEEEVGGAVVNIEIGKIYKTNKITLIILSSKEQTTQGSLSNLACKYLAKESRYITFLESGDMMEPTLLEKLFLFLEFQKQNSFSSNTQPPISMVNSMTVENMKYFNLHRVQESAHLLTQKSLFHYTFMIEKHVFEKLGGFNSNLNTEENSSIMTVWDFWVKFIQKGYRAWTIPEVLLWHNNIHDNTQSAQSEKKFISSHLKKRYKRMFGDDTKQELQSKGFLSSNNKGTSSGKSILKRLAHDRHKFHKGKDKSIILISENLNDPRRREFILKLLESLTFEYDWHVVVFTTDLEESNHALYRSEFECYSTDIFHLNHFVDHTNVPPDEHVLSLLIQYVISTRHIHNIFIMESTLGYKSLSLLPSPLLEFTRVMDYIYTINTNKYMTESVKHNDLIYKTFLSSPDLTQLSSLIEIKSEKTSILYPSVVNLGEFRRVKSSEKTNLLDYLTKPNDDLFTLIGSKEILNENENSKDLVISYWIAEEDQCNSGDIFRIINHILDSNELKRVKFLFLTDRKQSYNLDILPEDQKEKEQHTQNTRKLFTMLEELTSRHSDRILFVKPGKKASTRILKKYLRLFSPYSHVNLFSSDSCNNHHQQQQHHHKSTETSQEVISIPPIVFQSMATQNAILFIQQHYQQPNTALEKFINKFKIGAYIKIGPIGEGGKDEQLALDPIVDTLNEWLQDLDSLKAIRNSNTELVINLFNVHSVSNMIHSQSMH